MAAEGGCRAAAQTQFRGAKKEEFPGFMSNMLLGNPFPRSALFLYRSFTQVTFWLQEYERTMHLVTSSLPHFSLLRKLKCRPARRSLGPQRTAQRSHG